MKILLVDAYDSFVHIIDQYLRTLGVTTEVVRSRTRTPEELAAGRPDAVVLGPGPGHPAASGHVELVHAVRRAGAAAGGVPGPPGDRPGVRRPGGGRRPLDARTDQPGTARRPGTLPGAGRNSTVATRYHSLIVSRALPDELEETATAEDDGYVMGVRHRTLPVEGVQFHPESIMTEGGLQLFENFLAGAVR